jgi:glutaconate CoA-transferase subunit B
MTRDQVVAATGWPVRFADDVQTTAEPTSSELDTLRSLQAA